MKETSKERIALITGGSRGLGRAAALALADAGTDAVVTFHSNADAAASVVAEIESRGRRAVALELDTTAVDTFPAFAERLASALSATWGRDSFDALVNNAGYAGSTPFGAIEKAEIDRIVAVHFTGVVLLTQQLAPMLADGGRILNISTGLVRIPSNPAMSVYAAVKAAIETWTLYLAKQLGERRIAVNVLDPRMEWVTGQRIEASGGQRL
ncbi:SDR family NAD(P)-dependent oxidoreductase [Herbiconiux sp. UC225_62]|uniref:SDR family NAD(P)-dependent oxidoreductase n=1 Tax=Herbiconiux sp. UC225_62 TaxID=3350168 RepID=UPI0036D4299B